MKSDTFTFKSSDGIQIFTYRWMQDEVSAVKGVVQIAHGMAEHAARYERFANALAMEAASRLLNRKVLDCLKDIATGKAAEKEAEKIAEPAAETSEEKPAKAKKAAKKEPVDGEVVEEKPAKAKKAVKKVAADESAAEKVESTESEAPKSSKSKKSDKK